MLRHCCCWAILVMCHFCFSSGFWLANLSLCFEVIRPPFSLAIILFYYLFCFGSWNFFFFQKYPGISGQGLSLEGAVCVFTPKSTDGIDLYVDNNCSSLGPCRHHSADSVGGGGVGRQPGEHLRHVGPTEPPFPADSAHGADGPEGRHLEAPRLCGLRTQQGGLQQSRVQNTHKHSCVAVSQRENIPPDLAEIPTDDGGDHRRIRNRTLSLAPTT